MVRVLNHFHNWIKYENRRKSVTELDYYLLKCPSDFRYFIKKKKKGELRCNRKFIWFIRWSENSLFEFTLQIHLLISRLNYKRKKKQKIGVLRSIFFLFLLRFQCFECKNDAFKLFWIGFLLFHNASAFTSLFEELPNLPCNKSRSGKRFYARSLYYLFSWQPLPTFRNFDNTFETNTTTIKVKTMTFTSLFLNAFASRRILIIVFISRRSRDNFLILTY